MSVLSRVEGGLRYGVPLTWRDIRNSVFAADDDTSWDSRVLGNREVRLDLESEVREVDEGYLTVITARRLLVVTEDRHKLGSLMTQVEYALRLAGVNRGLVNGEFYVENEDQGDVWRLLIHDGAVTRQEARLVWPDDEEA